VSRLALFARALGIGRPGECLLRRGCDPQIFRSLHVIPWKERFLFGGVLAWDGIYWHRAVGIKGPDWEGGNWLGGSSWRHGWGPVVMCRNRCRGSLRSDIEFERNMGCSCMHLVVLWVRGRGQVAHQPLCVRRDVQ